MNELLRMKGGDTLSGTPPSKMAVWEKLARTDAELNSMRQDDDDDDDEDDDDTTTGSSMSDVSGSEDDSSDYDYDTDSDDEDDDDDDDGTLGASSMGVLEANYQLSKEKGSLNRGGSFHANTTKQQLVQQETDEPGNRSNRSMPTMQFEFDMGNVQLSEEDDKSMRELFTRMNSAKTMTYFQDAEEPVAIPKELEITHKQKVQSRRGSQDDLALLEIVPDKQSPQSLLDEIVEGLTGVDLPDSFWKTFFLDITPARKEAYSMEVVKAMRGQDIDKLRTLQQEGISMEACNAQGESLIHLACRRRNHQLVKFLVDETKVSVRVKDDWGKTPFHELCWNSRPGKQYRDQFDSVKLLVREAPELLFAKDKRGFTPLQYVPKDSWKDWRRFLGRYTKLIRCKVQLIGFVRSRSKLQETLQKAESAMSLLSGGKLL